MPQAVNIPHMGVGQLNAYVQQLLEEDVLLSQVAVEGEISAFKRYPSGHCYFTLKDAEGAISGVMFKWYAAHLAFAPRDGMRVVAFGSVTLYVRDGRYQLAVRALMPAGEGALAAQLEALKRRLAAEGLFDQARKRPLPAYPRRVALVTSGQGAALRDMLRISARRNPAIGVLVCPVAVQGAEAAGEIAAMLEKIGRRDDIDVIIVGRGGGSAEDLMAFSDERVVRAVAGCPVPVVSAIGHEVDTPLCDLAADVRAATPSHAAELVFPLLSEWKQRVRQARQAMAEDARGRLAGASQRVDGARTLLEARHPGRAIETARQRLETCRQLLDERMAGQLNRRALALGRATAALEGVSPLAPLGRGYALLQLNGAPVRSVAALAVGDKVEARLADGRAYLTVEGKATDGE
nr:exodeoxyribonuclease VII large subunit [bacterium]